ncbi:MAG: energy-coupling factor transporter ATPase [Eubacterium sp.]|jgi:energy-coupling factor transport system ATP-binding protein|nr:energy-coupling factor transporter ATPase [Eubacterium sp.]
MNIIEAKNLSYFYQVFNNEGTVVERNAALRRINLEIKKGEFIALLGHNGSGKSTLAKHFNGILTPDEGSLFVDGMDVSDEALVYDIRQTIGMVFQNPDNQIVATIVEEDVAFALENLGVPPGDIRARIDEAMKTTGIYDFRRHAPHQLSGGQKQRVAIAGIIAMEPACLVLDEPTAMLDPKGRKEIMKTIKKLNREKGITVVLITHYMEEATQADRVVVMDKGKIIMDGAPKQIFSQVRRLKEVGLDVPQATELMYLLSQSGLKVKEDIINEEECVGELLRLLLHQKN